MGDVFDQLRERQAAGAGCIGQTATSTGSADVDPAVLAAARQVLPALAGLTYEQARNAIWLTSSALDLSAVVQAVPALSDLAEVQPPGLSEVDRSDAREATLHAYRHSTYVNGLGMCLLDDLKAIKAAK